MELPALPVKLPRESRKRLSIIVSYESSNKPSIDQPTTSLNAYYTNPISYVTQSNEETKSNETECSASSTRSFFDNNIYLDPVELVSPSREEGLDETIEIGHYLSLNEFCEGYKQVVEPDSQYLSVSEMIQGEIEPTPKQIAPPIPPKREKSLSMTLLINELHQLRPKFTSSRISNGFNSISVDQDPNKDEYFVYNLPDQVKKEEELDLDWFKSRILSQGDNSICADCKSQLNTPKWISCVYLITLCDICARVHLKLGHEVNKFYIIEIDRLHQELTSTSSSQLNIHSFLDILAKCGNEVVNSLLEYQIDQSRHSLCHMTRESFIRAKYSLLQFINPNEIDKQSNYVAEMTRAFLNSGSSISMSVYYLLLGASRSNLLSSLLAASSTPPDPLQYLYLHYFQNLSKTASQIEYAGEAYELVLSENVKLRCYLRASSRQGLVITRLNNVLSREAASYRIDLASIVLTTCRDTGIEQIQLTWTQPSRQATSIIEFYNYAEKQIWLKQILYKLVAPFDSMWQNKLRVIIDESQIVSYGYMCVSDNVNSDSPSLLVLVESLKSQRNHFYKRELVLVDSDQFICYDLRKMVRVRRGGATSQMICMEFNNNKTLKLKSIKMKTVREEEDYLTWWLNKVSSFSQVSFDSIEDQYLSKENCPLIIEKSLAYLEDKYIIDSSFYTSLNSHMLDQSIHEHHNTSFGYNILHGTMSSSSGKKFQTLYNKLEREKDFRLGGEDDLTDLVLKSIRQFLRKNVSIQSLKSLLEQDEAKTMSFKKNNTVLFCTLRRICIHMITVLKYAELNKTDKDELIEFISRMFVDQDEEHFGWMNQLWSSLLDRSTQLFELERFLKVQFEIFDKLVKLKTVISSKF